MSDFEEKPELTDDEDESEDEDYVPQDAPSSGKCFKYRVVFVSDTKLFFVREDEDEPVAHDDSEASGDEDADGKNRKRKREAAADDDRSKVAKSESKKVNPDELWAKLTSDETPDTSVPESKPEDKKIEVPKGKPEVASPSIQAPKRTGGLSSLVAGLNKKKGSSTLLQSKQDWDSYKSEEGISEELSEHNRSKDSYVERQAFLMRSDLREFDREKEIRDKIRSRKIP